MPVSDKMATKIIIPKRSNKVSISIHDIIRVIGGRSFMAARIP
jgi:hypothetical protein